MVTRGISPKALLAALLPALGGLIAVGIQWAITGAFDKAELATALTAAAGSLLAFAGAWAGNPGTVVPVDPGPASDDLLGDPAPPRV